MSNIPIIKVRDELLKSKMGITGIVILVILFVTSIITIIVIPIETFQKWNDPTSWIAYPKTAVPVWVNFLTLEKIPEHRILDSPHVQLYHNGDILLNSQQYTFNFNDNDFPNDFIYEFSAQYSNSPLLQIVIIRPDNVQFELLSMSLPYSSSSINIHNERIFSTDHLIKKNLLMQSEIFEFDINTLNVMDIVFSKLDSNIPLNGEYTFLINSIVVNSEFSTIDSRLIIGGKSFGLMGTDDLRRDLAVGLLWGTPLALFIGIVVAIASVIMGLFYGVYAGFKGKKTDEALMRFNDVIYALPVLPFLIILSVTISNNLFLTILILTMFGWVGVAKVSRSMSLQIKTRGYVDAAIIMGQRDFKIITKHVLPQLLPYAFASIAISVPAAIITEAGISFLGLGDPTFPTWGQILHDANTFGAATRGLWWWIMPPGVMIAITGLAFVFIGTALDVIINPKLGK